jgi:hypothetical protein
VSARIWDMVEETHQGCGDIRKLDDLAHGKICTEKSERTIQGEL